MLKGIEAVNSGNPQKIEDQVGGRWYYSKICPIESYIQKHSDAEFSHSICKECSEKYYPDMKLYDD